MWRLELTSVFDNRRVEQVRHHDSLDVRGLRRIVGPEQRLVSVACHFHDVLVGNKRVAQILRRGRSKTVPRLVTVPFGESELFEVRA